LDVRCFLANHLSLHDKDYQIPFKFTGKIDKLTVKLGPDERSLADKAKVEKMKRDRQ
jgi:hypothetical protein